MKFRDYFSVKHILFAVIVILIFVALGLMDSASQVKVTFEDQQVLVKTDRYVLEVPYADVDTVELTEFPKDGIEIVNGADDGTMRTGQWTNESWGEHYICMDLESKSCIVVRLNDGRIFVFSGKDDAQTQQHYETFLTYLD